MRPSELHDHAAEAATLGAALSDAACWDAIAVLAPEDFHDPRHGFVFEAMRRLRASHRPVDHLTLADELKAMGNLAHVGGPAYLMRLDQSVPAAVNIAAYVATVRNYAVRRAAVAEANRLIQEACDPKRRPADVVLGSSAALAQLGAAGVEGIITGADAIEEMRLHLHAVQSGEAVPIIPTGIKAWDYLLGGVQPGTLTILGARPGIGKTALAMSLAINRAHAFVEAVEAKKPAKRTGIMWLEDPVQALVRRLLAYVSTVPVWRIGKEVLTGPALQMVGQGLIDADGLVGDAWRIRAASGLTAKQVAANMRQMAVQHDCNLFIVDNLTEIDLDADILAQGRGEASATANAVRELRNVAKDLNVAVVLLVHLTRAQDKNKNQQQVRPTLESSFGSSAIEKMARLMVFLYDDPEHPGYLAAYVPKQNEGKKYLEFWLRLYEPAALVMSTGGKVPEGAQGFSGVSDEGIEFIREEQDEEEGGYR